MSTELNGAVREQSGRDAFTPQGSNSVEQIMVDVEDATQQALVFVAAQRQPGTLGKRGNLSLQYRRWQLTALAAVPRMVEC